MDVELSLGLRDRLLICCGVLHRIVLAGEKKKEKTQTLFSNNIWLVSLISESFPKDLYHSTYLLVFGFFCCLQCIDPFLLF